MICCLSNYACNLDIPLEDKVTGNDAIGDVITARNAINAAYDSYPKNAVNFSVLSNDFFPTFLYDRDQYLGPFYQWRDDQIISFATELWSGYYKSVTEINVLLDSEQYIKFESSTDTEDWERIKGEAYALKALAYYDLLTLFSDRYAPDNMGIILKDKVRLEFLPRSSVSDCLAEIDRLLVEAMKYLEGKSKKYNHQFYLNYNAALFLRTKVALYKEDYATAIEYGEQLVSLIGYEEQSVSTSSYRNLWTDFSSAHKERIFSFFYKEGSLYKNYKWKGEGDEFAIRSLYDYTSPDIRYEVATKTMEMNSNISIEKVERALLEKYIGGSDAEDYSMNYMRLAELYFILAESYMKVKPMQADKALDRLNVFLKYRKVDAVPSSISNVDLLNRIIFEKEKEFIGEGVNFFDAKRHGYTIYRYAVDDEDKVTMQINTNDYRRTFPLPIAELRENVKQNPNWLGAE